jgi:hypothetical protein
VAKRHARSDTATATGFRTPVAQQHAMAGRK